MRVAIRTTCGRAIGFGHLRRCLTLAEDLHRRGLIVTILLTGDDVGLRLATSEGASAELIDHSVEAVLERIDGECLVLVDDYAIDGPAISSIRNGAGRVAVIDDLADRELDADLVLNANIGAEALAYRVGPDCRMLLGPRYALLRRSFQQLPKRRVPPRVDSVLVTLGGSDPQNLTGRIVATLRRVLPDARLEVVVGPLFSAPLGALEDDTFVTVHRSPPEIAALMSRADVAVTAGGQTTYELAAAGLPALALCIAENQRRSLTALAGVPTLVAVDEPDLASAMTALAADPVARQRMADAGQRLVDGMGTHRTAEELERLAST